MPFNLSVVFLGCLALAIAQYNPYSPHPPANARDPSLPSRSLSTYNRAQDFRAAGKNPGYRSSFTLPSRQESYGQQLKQLNDGSGYNGGSQRASAYNGQQESAMGYGSMGSQGPSSYNGGASAHVASSYGNGVQQDGSYDDLTQPTPDDPDGDGIVGVAGSDYPTYSQVPMTSFECAQQQFPGLYSDTEAQCQVFHICQDGGRYDSFLCPNGSIFNQQYFVCDWWYNVDCQSATGFYGLNADLYKDANRYSASASYAANLPSDSYSHANGQGPSAAYPSVGQPQASPAYSNGNGLGSARTASSGYGTGKMHSAELSAYGGGNGRGYSGTSSAVGINHGSSAAGMSSGYADGNDVASSRPSSSYGNGRTAAGISSTYANGNGPSRTSSAYVNSIGREGSVPSLSYGNGRGHSGSSSTYGNGNNRESSAISAYGNGNGRGNVGKSSTYGSTDLVPGPSHTSQHANKQLQNDDYSIADMPPLGY